MLAGDGVLFTNPPIGQTAIASTIDTPIGYWNYSYILNLTLTHYQKLVSYWAYLPQRKLVQSLELRYLKNLVAMPQQARWG